MNIIKSSFHPKCDLKDKRNYKRFNRILRDGTVIERILLDVPDIEMRENLICLHVLRNHVRIFYKREVGFNIVSRDQPWDFGIELDNKEKINVEITSIAEDPDLFKKMKREERLVSSSLKSEIPFHELKKLNGFFPNEDITKLVAELESKKTLNQTLIKNPYFEKNGNIFLSDFYFDEVPIQILIKDAIESKEAKKHNEKENTILIIDNRTVTYEYDDLHKASEELSAFYDSCSFKEIWFYTGYCTNNDGNYAEFSLGPLKLPEDKWQLLADQQKETPLDENRIMYL